MFKHAFCVIGLALICSQANAGIWDSIVSFFGGEETTEQVEKGESVSDGDKTSDMINKGVSLIPLLTQTLGVSDGQAKGGMGSILQAAQLLLSGTEYGKLLESIPNASQLMSLAPKASDEDSSSSEASGGLMDAALSAASENSETLKAGTQLLSQFKELGMSADMIPKFTQTTNQYLQQSDSSDAVGLLDKISSL